MCPMPETTRFLTKSRFKLGMECPTKLFYAGKEREYANENLEDSFLAALAQGGFQVGELARAYFPGGHQIRTLDRKAVLVETSALLKKPSVVIFEAAIQFRSLFIRTDILVKTGRRLDLIEVKAKSYDLETDGDFIGKQGGITSVWKPYLLDAAFQKYVLAQAFPDLEVRAFLMLADKSSTCPTDGLHQKFRIVTNDQGRRRAEMTSPLSQAEMDQRILCQVNVDRACSLIEKTPLEVVVGPTGFLDRIEWLAGCYERNQKIITPPSTACAKCEFRATADEEVKGLMSGFKECWRQDFKWNDADFSRPSVLDLWNYRGKANLIDQRRVKMADVTEADINPAGDGRPGLSQSQRQWLQVEKAQREDASVWIDQKALKRVMKQWKFPLHFIDFETTRVAIPFNAGCRPYELVAFQFSHHVVREDGTIEHKGQYLNAERGVFPNYEFVRALKKELEVDEGAIFRYATHENSTLTAIDRQMAEDPRSPGDQAELRAFIRSITNSPKDSTETWTGPRSMIDLCEMVKRYYYAPQTNGSNSIKAVLPAILNTSDLLKAKYAKPIYGSAGGIPSLNFKDQVWIKMSSGQVQDPYKLLPKMFAGISDHDFGRLSEDDELRDGGAAMTAYARMQFEEMEDGERLSISQALRRYCELDTLAMVMIYEEWQDAVG